MEVPLQIPIYFLFIYLVCNGAQSFQPTLLLTLKGLVDGFTSYRDHIVCSLIKTARYRLHCIKAVIHRPASYIPVYFAADCSTQFVSAIHEASK